MPSIPQRKRMKGACNPNPSLLHTFHLLWWKINMERPQGRDPKGPFFLGICCPE
jgi:hypothetical protein